MGYGFSGKHRKTDKKCIFYEECMYAYQPVFRECFGREISELSGRVTKKQVLTKIHYCPLCIDRRVSQREQQVLIPATLLQPL